MTEYQVTDCGVDKAELADHCNGLAAGGWEVVSLIPITDFPRLPQTLRVLSRREDVPAHDRAVLPEPDPEQLHGASLFAQPSSAWVDFGVAAPLPKTGDLEPVGR